MRALGSAMDEPEDLMQLILGMEDTKVFNEIFSASIGKEPKDLQSWFDAKTQTMGGQKVIDKVRDLIGRAEKFDYKDLAEVPRLDLQDLQPFFEAMLSMNGRRPKNSEEGMSFKTPAQWLTEITIKRSYKHLSFDREAARENKTLDVAGFGHPLFGKALDQALGLDSCYTCSPALAGDLVIFNVRDRVTSTGSNVRISTAGVLARQSGQFKILKDESLVSLLTQVLQYRGQPEVDIPLSSHDGIAEQASEYLTQHINELGLPFTLPEVEATVMIQGRNE